MKTPRLIVNRLMLGKTVIRYSIVSCLLLGMPFSAFSLPQISSVAGDLSHGSKVILQGSDFGSHADHSGSTGDNYLHGRFEDVEHPPNGYITGMNCQARIATTGNRPNSAFNLMHSIHGGPEETYTNGNGITTTNYSWDKNRWYNLTYGAKVMDQYFVSAWIMIPEEWKTKMPDEGGQCKFMQVQKKGAGTGEKQYWYVLSSTCAGKGRLAVKEEVAANNKEYNNICLDDPGAGYGPVMYDSWVRFSVWMDWKNKRTEWYCNGKMVRTVNTVTSHDNNAMSIGTYMANYANQLTPEWWIQSDDHFFNHTRARVELGDASTYSACTKLEIQLPRKWSASSIEVELNQGAFQPGETVYAYVIDHGNNVSPGKAITLGSSTGVAHSPSRVTLGPAFSVLPGRNGVRFSIQRAGRDGFALTVYDAGGKLVWSYHASPGTEGHRLVQWSNTGGSLGALMARMNCGNTVHHSRFLLLR